ncbi:MAG: hypothetical protein U9O87_08685 [Verrucomicrobiota bacterium]|nr:hypothetical protein [Verrucomicrobiota bacterium]
MVKFKEHKTYFSLVELLVVIVLVSILFGIALAPFQRMISGNNVNSVAKNIGSLLGIARQKSVAARNYVALIMPATAGGNINERYHYGCARIAFVDSNYNFESWIDDSSWYRLPTGVKIMEVDGDIGINQTGVLGAYSKQPADNATTLINGVDFSEIFNGPISVDNVRSIVFSSTGKCKGSAVYATIGTAAYKNSYWIIKNAQIIRNEASQIVNESSADQITLHVNRFTGAITYKMPINY